MPGHSIAEEGTQHLVEAGRIFGQQQAQRASFNLDTLPAAKDGLKLFNAGDNRFPGDVQRLGGCDCCQGIVDVVKPGQRNNDLSLPAWRLDRYTEPVKAVSMYFLMTDACVGACALAVCASI